MLRDLRSIPKESLRETPSTPASEGIQHLPKSMKETEVVKGEGPANVLSPEKRESGQISKGLRGNGTTESRKEGVTRGRQGSDAAAQELALIRMALSQKAEDASEDADMLLAKKLQAEELQRGGPSAAPALPKKRTASTLDQFFKRQKL